MKLKIKSILSSLEEAKENLLSLSDDIWLSINHNDNKELQEGITFKTEFNNKLTDLDRLSAEIALLVEQFAGMNKETEEAKEKPETKENERIIKELNIREPHSLDEDFMYKRPFGIVFQGTAYKDLTTWRSVYLTLLNQLKEHDRSKFETLATAEEFISKRGNTLFSNSEHDMRFSRKVGGTVYAELNLSANSLRDAMKKVLNYFGLDVSEVTVYLKEDRDFQE